MSFRKYTCPCCGYRTLDFEPPGTYDICPICFWEDDGIQFKDPDYVGGANQSDSLRITQRRFLNRFTAENGEVKLPKEIKGYIFEGYKDVSKICRMSILEMIKIFFATESPIEKILDVYSGVLEVPESNYVFNTDDLSCFLSEEDIEDYLVLTQRKSYVKVPNGEGHIHSLINLNDDEADIKMKEIKSKFVNAVKNEFARKIDII